MKPARSCPLVRFVGLRRCLPVLALVSGLALLAGCAVNVPKLPQEMPAAWQHALQANAAPAPDLRGWWHAFDDPRLDALVSAALADNLAIGEAVLRIEAARLLAAHAGTPYRPLLSAHTQSEPTPDSSASYFQFGFDARWELALFGRGESRHRLADANLGLAETAAQAARVSTVAEVVRACVELRAAEQRLDLLQRAATLATDERALVATRQRLRLASATDLANATAAVATAEAALHEPRLAIDTTLQQLAVLLGRDRPDPAWAEPGPPLVVAATAVGTPPVELLRTRPEIRQAEFAVLEAAGKAGLASADRFPRIGLGGSLTYSSKALGGSRLSTTDSIVSIGPAIDMPLFDWGMRQALADARGRELEASVLAYRQAVLQGVAEVETALATLEQQRARAAALARVVDARAGADAASAQRKALGLADGSERVATGTALVEARLEASAAQRAHSLAFIALYKALGGAPLPAGVTP